MEQRDEKKLIEQVMRRGGFGLELDAMRATRATLEALGLHLDGKTTAAVAVELPPPYSQWLRSPEGARRVPASGADALYREVAAREGVSLGFGIEHTQVVAATLLEWLGDDERRAFLDAIPEPLAARIVPEPSQESGPPAQPAREPAPRGAGRRTLASARPGSSRPLSEADPGQRESVARSEDPRGDAKLSGSRGEPRGRNRPLSTGRPGSARPLSETED